MIKLINRKSFSGNNFSFNTSLTPLVENIFQAEHLGNIEYIKSDMFNFKDDLYMVGVSAESNLINVSANQECDDNDCYINLAGLGILEKNLAIQLCFSSYTNIVVTGALGSGKSALVGFVLKHLIENINHDNCPHVSRCNKQAAQVIELNFNKNYPADDCDFILKKFRLDFRNQLRFRIRKLFSNKSTFDAFYKTIEGDSDAEWAPHFDEFFHSTLSPDTQWDTFDTTQKCKNLFDWIEMEEDFRLKIDTYSYLLQFLTTEANFRRCCFVLFFDNLDRLPDYAQNIILDEIFSFSDRTQIKTVISLRLTNFGWVRGDGSYDFGQFPNAGQRPVSIVQLRIQHFLQNLTDESYTKFQEHIDKEHFRIFLSKIRYINDLLKENFRLKDVFQALSGNSIRRGLNLSKKILINGVVDYKTEYPFEDDTIIPLFLSVDNQNINTFDEKLTVNVFKSNRNNATLLILRMLQLIQSYDSIFNGNIRIKTLISQLNKFVYWEADEILYSINELLHRLKKLIYIDSNNRYKTHNDLIKSHQDIVNFTCTGKLYMEKLVCNLLYVQECLFRINWDDRALLIYDNLPNEIEYNDPLQKVVYVRKCLTILKNLDAIQTRQYLKKLGRKDEKLVFSLVTSPIIANIAHAIYLINRKKARDVNVHEELHNWLDLLMQCQRDTYDIFKQEDKIIDKRIHAYRNLLFKDLVESGSRGSFSPRPHTTWQGRS